MEEQAMQHGGEISAGTVILTHCGDSFIALAVMCRNDLFKDTGSQDSYYLTFRNILFATDEFNRKLSLNVESVLPTVSPTTEGTNKSIAKILFPIYFDITGMTERLEPETMKFAYQSGIAMASFFRWKKCLKRKKSGLSGYRKYVQKFEAQLKKNNQRSLLRHKQKTFMEYLGSEKLARRGLLDDEEAEWLIEACSFSKNVKSPFALNHRLQRLGFVALSAFLTDKHFKTGDEFQMKLRALVLENKQCLEWLLRIASSGSISLCSVVSSESIGRKVRFASGATSTLYRAKWENGETVSVKLYNADVNRSAILHEITLMSLLKHPNIIPIYAWGIQTPDKKNSNDESAQVFCISPYAKHGSLFHVIRESPREFAFESRYRVALQICQGLEYLHSLNLIHRDIKSLNIFIGEDCHVYVGDIGDARITAENMTKNIGTVQWMPPEMFAGTEYSLKSDIYSLGMVLYEIISNTAPFQDIPPATIPMIVLGDKRPPFPPGTAKPWEKLIQSMWHTKQKQRPKVAAVLEQLSALKDVPFM